MCTLAQLNSSVFTYIWTLNKLGENQFDIDQLSKKNNQHYVSLLRQNAKR